MIFGTDLGVFYRDNNQTSWIDGNPIFAETGISPNTPSFTHGNWANIGPAYLVVKIETLNDTVFAWINMMVQVGKITIYDYALFGEYLSVEENQISVSAIYPNPSNGNFTISFEEYAEPIDFEITDITGRAVYNGIITSQNTEVNLSGCSKGMYFVRSSDEKSVAKKIVIQ